MSEVADSTVVTLSEMRSFLNIPTAQTGKDALLVELLNSYNAEMELYIGVTMINSTYTESYDGDGTAFLELNHYPIISVTSLTVDSTELTEDDDFYVYKADGYIKLDSDTFDKDLQNIDIVYVAGHGIERANISKVLKNALKTWVARVFKAEVIDFSQMFDESSLAHIKSQMMPWDIKQKLDYFRCRHW
jgi:uncharacterized phiE125 gp8 family phage protein